MRSIAKLGMVAVAATLVGCQFTGAYRDAQYAASATAYTDEIKPRPVYVPYIISFPDNTMYFYPIYEEATRLDLVVAVHIANGSPQLMDQFKPRYDRMGGFAQFRIPTVITCLSLMMSDVPQTFPKLRWAFVEASAQWVPWVVKEAIRRSGTKGFPKLPFKEFNIYVTTETNDDFEYVLRYAGEDNVVIGTDYGHTDASSEVDAIDIFRANDLVADPVKKKILDDNPRALYAL